MNGKTYLDGKVTLYCGDSRDVLRTLSDSSVDSIVSDPPYALVSITKRFGSDTAAPAKGGVYARSSAGFMGKQWDTGDKFRNIDEQGSTFQGDSGSAARFFYTAKADAEDRLGSRHPTVKPLDLMQYLVRLVTPKGGTVLDPFAGSGTTGEAAWREGMRAILIEREREYQADIARRMDLASKPTKRAAVAASKNNLEKPDDLPLFRRDA